MRFFLLTLLFSAAALAQPPVAIQVDASKTVAPFKPIWKYFGYDEPNYTYMKNGRKLVGELAAASRTPVYIRAHNLLTTGDAQPALKWGSTNAYTEDASGKPVYDWTVIDRIFQTYLDAGAKPFVEIGFTPKALSPHPDPYQHNFPNGDVFTGWAYPPNDYKKWSELVYQWVKHTEEKYGREEVATWYWEVWNEPNIGYWHGTPKEYDKLYDYTVDAVRRAFPGARVGGPATTGPANAKAAAFLKQFLEHCESGKNAATGKTGAPLDFITYHAKGRPKVVDGKVRMGLSQNMRDVLEGFKIVKATKFRNLPIVLSESDPEGCAACSARTHPENAYRNGPLYPAYTAAAMDSILKLAAEQHVNIEGMLTWAFEFEDQPWFDGFRTLATNGVDKPVINLFRMAGLMEGRVVQSKSSAGAALDSIVAQGVGGDADVDALAVASNAKVSVLVWNYQDDDKTDVPAAPVELNVTGMPEKAGRLQLRHYRIDHDHSNSYTPWKALGSPQQPTPEQYAQLEAAGQLQLLESPRWISAAKGTVKLKFDLPRQGISLIELSWQ